MHKFSFYCIVLLLAQCSVSLAQSPTKPKQELGINLLTWERNYETQNNMVAMKLVPGVYYARFFEGWAWVSSFGYGDNLIDDNCTGCGDQFFGIGRMKEWAIHSGFRRLLFQARRFPLKPFLESGAYYAHLRYSGDFDGGRSGRGIRFDDTHWTAGAYGRLGLTYSPNQLLTISAYSGYKIGMGRFQDKLYGKDRHKLSMGGSLVQFAVGYRF